MPVGATPPPTGAPSVLPTDAPTVGPSNGQTPTFGFVLSGTQPEAVSPIPGSDFCHVLIDARSRTWTASFIAASADGRRWEIEVRTRTGAYRGPGTYTAVADEVRASVQVRDDTGDGWGGAATAGQLLINGPDPVSGVVDITVRADIDSRLPDGSVEQVTGGFDCVDARVIE